MSSISIMDSCWFLNSLLQCFVCIHNIQRLIVFPVISCMNYIINLLLLRCHSLFLLFSEHISAYFLEFLHLLLSIVIIKHMSCLSLSYVTSILLLLMMMLLNIWIVILFLYYRLIHLPICFLFLSICISSDILIFSNKELVLVPLLSFIFLFIFFLLFIIWLIFNSGCLLWYLFFF